MIVVVAEEISFDDRSMSTFRSLYWTISKNILFFFEFTELNGIIHEYNSFRYRLAREETSSYPAESVKKRFPLI